MLPMEFPMSLRPLQLLFLVAAALAAAPTRVALLTDDPFERDVVTIASDAPLGTIVTRCQQVRGTVDFDPTNLLDKPVAHFELDAARLNTGILLRDEHLRGPGWLDVDHFPKIAFELKELKAATKSLTLTPGRPTPLDAVGALTVKGQTKDVPVRLTLTWLKADDQTAQRLPGDLLRVDASFDLLLSEFGVALPDRALLMVANRQQVEVRLFASTQRLVPRPDAPK